MRWGYRPELDGLRAVAVLAVMAYHIRMPGFWATGGMLGVDVFFVLSGFLITSILAGEIEASGRVAYWRFIGRRARRLAPALMALLIVYGIAAPIFFANAVDRLWIDVPAAAFYVTNWRECFWPAPSPLLHTWSLAIEEQFYLVWPIVLTALMRLERRRAAQLLVGAWAAITLARLVLWATFPSDFLYYSTPLHATGLLLGSALALNPIRSRYGLVAGLLLGATFIWGWASVMFPVVAPVAELASVLVIAGPPTFLAAKPLAWLGRISYGVYLWQTPILWAAGPAPSLVAGAGLVAASIAAGWLSNVLVERWFWRPRDVATIEALPSPGAAVRGVDVAAP